MSTVIDRKQIPYLPYEMVENIIKFSNSATLQKLNPVPMFSDMTSRELSKRDLYRENILTKQGVGEDMIDMILTMIRGGYCFNVDRERLRDAMEDITYMLCPEDDINKDRVSKGLEYDEEDSEDYSEDDIYEMDNKDDNKDDKDDEIEDIGNTSELS